MEGFQEEQQEAPTDAYLTDDGTSYVIVPETEGEQVDYEKAEQAVIEALDAGAASVDLEEKDVYRKPDITQDDEALNGKMAELNHLTAARITYAIGENSYAIDRATLQSWLVQGRMEPTRFRRTKRQLLCAIWRMRRTPSGWRIPSKRVLARPLT